ncbi:MAG: cation diffusion facilitator family transporter [Lachnospiraceae bacterium]|nr:cation diffusion facilitator family transporter [Lachnospiraceae bacterium]
MVSLFAKLFIKDYQNTKSPSVRKAYGMLCGLVGIGLNILLFIGKFLAGTLSHSIAITADAFNNLSDAGSSFITLAGFKLASQKPDPDHPYGHGRIEYLSGLFVSLAILLMALELLKSSFEKILHPQDTAMNTLILVFLVVSILVKLYMSYYNHTIGKKIDSAALLATAADSRSDTLATLLVVLSSLISEATGFQIDGYCGLIVGLFIFYSGINAAKETINPLLGQAPDKQFVENVEEIVMSHDMILGIHDMMVHDYGPGRVMVSLHAEVPASGDILEIHDLIDHIENEINEKLNCEATIHMDPIMNDDPQVNAMKEIVSRIILGIDDSLHFHDFRMVVGPTHTNLIFDVLVPYKFKMSDSELLKRINEEVKKVNESYFIVAKIDHTYV